jgi:hypothetical protein
MSRKLTIAQFKENAIKIHGNVYDYSDSNYNGYEEKILIKCKKHGKFYQTPHNHIGNEQGCPICHRLTKTTNEFIINAKKIHKNRFDYSDTKYINNYTPVIIKCHVHGNFTQLPKNHLNGTPCPKCSKEKETHTTDDFIKSAIQTHGQLYNYDGVDYKTSYDKVKIICRKHGPFWIRPNNHLASKSGCPKCRWSKGELKIFNYLNGRKIEFERNKTFPLCVGKTGWTLKYDFYIPSVKLLIEYDGEQHFKPSMIGYYKVSKNDVKNNQCRDRIKDKFANDNGIKLLRIPYWKERHIEKILEENL